MEEYCSTVKTLLEATAAMSLAVENKKPSSPTVPETTSTKAAYDSRATSRQPILSESSLEDSVGKPPRDRRKSYSQGQNTSSSLDSKSTNNSNQRQQNNNDAGNTQKPSQSSNKTTSNFLSSSKSVDRRYSIASTHIAIANHIASSNQGMCDNYISRDKEIKTKVKS